MTGIAASRVIALPRSAPALRSDRPEARLRRLDGIVAPLRRRFPLQGKGITRERHDCGAAWGGIARIFLKPLFASRPCRDPCVVHANFRGFPPIVKSGRSSVAGIRFSFSAPFFLLPALGNSVSLVLRGRRLRACHAYEARGYRRPNVVSTK